MMLWEPDRFSNIYIYFRAGENQSGYQIIIIFKLTQYSDKSILIYTTTTGFHNLIIKFFIN